MASWNDEGCWIVPCLMKRRLWVELLLCSNIPTFLSRGSPWLFNTTVEYQNTHLSLSNLNCLTKQEFRMFETSHPSAHMVNNTHSKDCRIDRKRNTSRWVQTTETQKEMEIESRNQRRYIRKQYFMSKQLCQELSGAMPVLSWGSHLYISWQEQQPSSDEQNLLMVIMEHHTKSPDLHQ